MNRPATFAVLAGVLPAVAASLAFLININAGLEACFPFWEGCMSVSRGIRSGPGLLVFKILAWPSALLMIACWHCVGNWIKQQSTTETNQATLITWMGMLGAVFFVVYAMWLGSEGEFYRWLRRYGVVFYFGLTALAQLFFASFLWNRRQKFYQDSMRQPLKIYMVMISLSWALGVASAFKRKLIENPALQDQVENLLEWNFALVLSLTFVAIGMVFQSKDKNVS